MYDYIKRFLIAMAVALSIGILFIGTRVSFAETSDNYEVVNFIWPTVGLVTDTFGTRNGKHYGIDIAAPRGTTVVSVSDGVVVKSYYSTTYGNVVFIEHTDGYETVYAHLHKRLVEEGATVYQGEEIGTVGNTGRSSGDHLHFEVHDGNWTMSKKNAIDPFLVIGDNKDSFFVLSDEYADTEEYQVASAYEEHHDQPSEVFYIKVKKGDSLWSLAKGYQVSVDEIKSWNQLSSDSIVVNQRLKIVPKGSYIVQKGDTLWKIAEQSGTSVSKIKKMNGLKDDRIQIGTLLTVGN
ncbi:LysM peptidoglycan-binding domain-containing protein [Anaerobacillus alkaliphilus]|uniref:LysM peptidoglycan-binding domain-containing protein n=1 Tax=Anaerobacillus alkaliphilus TaxID=1548597 RepID=A0A4Q0VW15_9BACI|nr:M23 family metallopeptidase [Anaerobacillus alkaliphilus]RXJ03893.1 LysM peptidoglycan-binding domain-containing protein [Anaerobacillus alkaliphilus]